MSKNFTEAEGRRYKGRGFHCPLPKLRFSFISKNCGLEPFHTSISLYLYMCPMAFLLFLIFMSMYIIYPDNKVFILLWFVSAIGFTLYLLTLNLNGGE
jgi:hypothetical protein